MFETGVGTQPAPGGATQNFPAPGGSSAPPPAPAPAPAPAGGPSGTGGSGAAMGAAGGANPTPGGTPTQPGFGAGSSPATQTGQPLANGQPAAQPNPEVEQLRQQLAAAQAQMRQYQPFVQMGYQSWQQAQQKPAAPGQSEPQKPKSVFGVPDFDTNLLQFLTRDGEGNLVPMMGAPPDLATRYHQYQKALQEAHLGFFRDPMAKLAEPVKEMVAPLIKQAIEQHFGGYREQQQVTQVLRDNSDWLYVHQNGQPAVQVDPLTGRQQKTLTPAGQMYFRGVQAAEQLGVRDAGGQHQYAMQSVLNALMQHRLAQQHAPAQGQAAAQQFVQNAQQNAAFNNPAQPSPLNAPPPQPQKSLREQMMEDFRAAGITNEVLQSQMAGR